MSNFRRRYVLGGTFFFTLVTEQRKPILTTDLGRRTFRDAIEKEQNRAPFDLVACVLLPDHFHSIWNLPDGDDRYPMRWRMIKERFTRDFLAGGGRESRVSTSKRRKGERGVWQRRFWEHTVSDDNDFKRCLDYIHWNPVKHGFVTKPVDYPWSTFRKFVELGEYTEDWGTSEVNAEIAGAEWD